MKKLLFIALVITALSSCEKLDDLFDKDKSNTCPVVTNDQIPQTALKTMSTKYPQATTTTWFNKDGKGYCAVFNSNGKQTKAMFDNNGNFQSEEIEQQGDHEDDDDSGCDTEIEDND